ncbi:MAG: hypothetical protein DRJ35_07495 [Thermoprotei archaeon]|nr:MAG: hypothetical protein DRJ35_07495 [Thermoprotei archaeon]
MQTPPPGPYPARPTQQQQEYLKREDVVGKKVIDGKANEMGVVKDIAFSTRGEIAFLVEKKDGSMETVPLSKVERIGEYIVLYKEMGPIGPGPVPPGPGGPVPQPEPIICPQCGYPNPPGTKFCQRCGAKLPEKKKGLFGFKI